MAEIKIACPGCKQHIQCDELWRGHEIACPSCQTAFTIPAAPAAAPEPAQARRPAALVPPPPPAGSKGLSAGATQVARQASGTGTALSGFKAPPKQGGNFAKWGKLVFVALVFIGTGVYFAWYFGMFNKSEEEVAAANPPAADAGQPAGDQADAAPPAPAPKLDQVIAPVYTLDAKTAKIPEGKVNGLIHGTNFVMDIARIERTGPSTILTLRQGTGVSADREVLIYLRLGQNEPLTNRTFTVTSDTKFGAPTIIKRWKHDPRFAPQSRNFTGGYALQVETTTAEEDGSIHGKVYLALPDPEKTVVAGHFKALSSVVQVINQPAPDSPEGGTPSGGMDSNMRRRYGVR